MHNQLNNSPSEFQTMEVEASNQAIVELSPEAMEQVTGGALPDIGRKTEFCLKVIGKVNRGCKKAFDWYDAKIGL